MNSFLEPRRRKPVAVDDGKVATVDNTMRETFWACPNCGTRRVHITSHGDGIICGSRGCGFAPFVGGLGRTAPAVRVIPPPLT